MSEEIVVEEVAAEEIIAESVEAEKKETEETIEIEIVDSAEPEVSGDPDGIADSAKPEILASSEAISAEIEVVDSIENESDDEGESELASSSQLSVEKKLSADEMQLVLEAAIFAMGEPLSIEKMKILFRCSEDDELVETETLREVLTLLQEKYESSAVELKEVASGFRFQAKKDYALYMQRLWEKRPPRFSKAFMETLALIAYQQPISRGEIESVRGVAVNSQIIKTMLEREWIKILGYKDVPGKPALFGTTNEFLNYFNLKSLSDMPTLASITNLEEVGEKLESELGFMDGLGEHPELEAQAAELVESEAAIDEALSVEMIDIDVDFDKAEEAESEENTAEVDEVKSDTIELEVVDADEVAVAEIEIEVADVAVDIEAEAVEVELIQVDDVEGEQVDNSNENVIEIDRLNAEDSIENLEDELLNDILEEKSE